MIPMAAKDEEHPSFLAVAGDTPVSRAGGFRSMNDLVISGLVAQAQLWRVQALEDPARAPMLNAAATALEKRAMELARNKRVRGSGEK